MTRVSPSTCNLCEAECGILVEHDGERVLGVRGDPDDPQSRGHICPKAAALADLHADPDRLRRPLERQADGSYREVSWEHALDAVADRLVAIQREHGRDAVAMYLGNPTVHSPGATLFGLVFRDLLGTRHSYSSNSMDALPRMLTSYLLYGSQALLPVPDLERTDFWLILGANPVVSNGSIMSAPGCKRHIAAIKERGGRVVVVDPRRTETAKAAGEHLFIRPGTDALLVAALVHTVFAQGLSDPGRVHRLIARGGLERVRALVEPFTPERVAPITGIPAEQTRRLALDFARARSAVCYGRMGTCTQEFGTLTTWLIDCLNIVTGNFDRPGGAMFATPAVDLARLAALIGQRGSFARYRGAGTGLPEFSGELPVAELCHAIEDCQEGQNPARVRALITYAGNPVLSMPNGARVDRALQNLDFMVAIDIYRNETSRHADYILPTTMVLERDHYPLIFSALAVRNGVRRSRAVFPKHADMRHDWQILGGLAQRLFARRSRLGKLASLAVKPLLSLGPDAVVRLGLRIGAYNLSFDELNEHPHGLDLGPLVPRLPKALSTRSRTIELTPEPLVDDMERLRASLEEPVALPAGSLALISRRHVRSNNSWMHNSPRLVKGKELCVLSMHPDDADARAIADGERVTVRSRVGALEVTVRITDEMMPGVVCMPFGWGHDRPGSMLSVASAHAGVSINDITDETRVDPLSGCTSFALPVMVERANPDRARELDPTTMNHG